MPSRTHVGLVALPRSRLNNVVCMQIHRGDQFDQIVIETSGLANLAPIIFSLTAVDQMTDHIRLDGLITLVDAKNVERHLDDKKQDADAVNEAVAQIAYADRILLNKIDVVSHWLFTTFLEIKLYTLLVLVVADRHKSGCQVWQATALLCSCKLS